MLINACTISAHQNSDTIYLISCHFTAACGVPQKAVLVLLKPVGSFPKNPTQHLADLEMLKKTSEMEQPL